MPYPLTPANPTWAVVILAAGRGTRMGPGADKALSNLAGISMIEHLFRTCVEIDPRQVIVVRQGDQPGLGELHFPHEIVIQVPTLAGTGAALLAAEESIFESVEFIAVLFVDNPLLTAQSITDLIGEVEHQDAVIGLTTALEVAPGSRGRVIRHNGEICQIREAAGCTTAQLAIREVNCGAMILRADWIRGQLERMGPDPESGEIYLTDLVRIASDNGQRIVARQLCDLSEGMGCDDLESLSLAEMAYFRRRARQICAQGVRIRDLDAVRIGPDVEIGAGSLIEPNVEIAGKSTFGANCQIGPHTSICNSEFGNNCSIISSRVSQAGGESNVSIGPSALVREGTYIGAGAHVGNCVEIKNSYIGPGTLIGHLCYVGDANIGRDCVIGAGTITCNFDGRDKHPTTIGEKAFIGSNCSLVAPLEIGAEAVIGAGSVVTRDVPSGVTVYGNPARPSTKERGPTES